MAKDQRNEQARSQQKREEQLMIEQKLETAIPRLTALGFSKDILPELERQLGNNEERIFLRESRPEGVNSVDIDLHLRNGREELYFNTFRATLNDSEPKLKKDEAYIVIPNGKKDSALKFNSPYAAVRHFRNNVPGDAELRYGITIDASLPLVSRKDDKITIQSDEFRKTFRVPPVDHTVWLDRNRELFNINEAANLVAGRAVFKEDMYNTRTQSTYSAWMQLDVTAPRNGTNFSMKSYGENYWKMADTLGDYKIKELEDPEKAAKVEASLKAGNRPLVTSTNRDGQDVKVFMEANPQYKSFRFFNEETGKSISHADYLKPDALKVYDEKREKRGYNEEVGVAMKA